jgi:nitrogen fixation protein
MNLERINQIVEDYQKLEEMVKETFSKLCELDSKKYSSHRYIDKISIEMGIVDVTCDNSWRGCTDYAYYGFPIEWLTLDDVELEKVVEAKKIEREAEKRRKEEKKREEERLEREEREYQKYLSLKKKFENKV